jgi:hypothetical protein
MPRSKKKQPAAPAEVARPSTSQSKLKSLMAAARSAQKDVTEISGSLGAEIKVAVEKHHLHRKAFRVIVALDRMEPEKLADFLDCFEHYLDISGLNARAKSAPRMNFEQDAEGPEDDGPENVVKGNFPPPSGVAAE